MSTLKNLLRPVFFRPEALFWITRTDAEVNKATTGASTEGTWSKLVSSEEEVKFFLSIDEGAGAEAGNTHCLLMTSMKRGGVGMVVTGLEGSANKGFKEPGAVEGSG